MNAYQEFQNIRKWTVRICWVTIGLIGFVVVWNMVAVALFPSVAWLSPRQIGAGQQFIIGAGVMYAAIEFGK